MKRKFLGALALAIPFAASATPENYTVDPVHSIPYFAVDHLTYMTIHGRFNKMTGKFTIDRAAKTGSVEMSIEAASIDTADSEKGNRARSRDEHLRSADFFNATEFPRVTYKSTGVKFNGDNVVEIEGQLTMIGVTKPLTFKLERWKCGPHPFNKKEMCGGNAVGSIKRSDFGMKYGLPSGIGDETKLMIGFEAYKD
jgi:polyisoprenoid-binding protein YceI